MTQHYFLLLLRGFEPQILSYKTSKQRRVAIAAARRSLCRSNLKTSPKTTSMRRAFARSRTTIVNLGKQPDLQEGSVHKMRRRISSPTAQMVGEGVRRENLQRQAAVRRVASTAAASTAATTAASTAAATAAAAAVATAAIGLSPSAPPPPKMIDAYCRRFVAALDARHVEARNASNPCFEFTLALLRRKMRIDGGCKTRALFVRLLSLRLPSGT